MSHFETATISIFVQDSLLITTYRITIIGILELCADLRKFELLERNSSE